MPNVNGEITIDSMTPVSDTGVPLGAATFANADSTVDQLIAGTSTLFNATIYLLIYDADKVPQFEKRFELELVVTTTPPTPTPDPLSLYANDDLSSTAGAWSVKVPKDTFQKAAKYVIIAKDSDGLVSTSQDMTTA